ncbi:hypothetical protein [Kribbella solani]|uniref:hypothetical protein n=1 Tax=Kribbella solani TaxID=236067 RepID=UPI0029B67773|nr:hypothetical protein [Kribbella solani]MDX2970718.1 hypothetical protein [Kribbella solani]
MAGVLADRGAAGCPVVLVGGARLVTGLRMIPALPRTFQLRVMPPRAMVRRSSVVAGGEHPGRVAVRFLVRPIRGAISTMSSPTISRARITYAVGQAPSEEPPAPSTPGTSQTRQQLTTTDHAAPKTSKTSKT